MKYSFKQAVSETCLRNHCFEWKIARRTLQILIYIYEYLQAIYFDDYNHVIVKNVFLSSE